MKYILYNMLYLLLNIIMDFISLDTQGLPLHPQEEI